MKCVNCGAMNADDALFCSECGNKLEASVEVQENVQVEAPVEEVPVEVAEQPAEEPVAVENEEVVPVAVEEAAETVAEETVSEEPVAKKGPKLAPIIAACVAALIVLIVIIAIATSGGKFDTVKNQYLPLQNDGEVMVVSGNKILKTKIGDDVATNEANFDGTVMLVSTVEDELFLIKGKKIKSIADDVASFDMAAEGEYAAYKDTDGTLFLLKLSNGKATKIEEDVSSYKISPDGKAVIYSVLEEKESKDDDSSSDDYMSDYMDDYLSDYLAESSASLDSELFLFVGKKSYSIGDGYTGVAVSNGGKYVYATKDSELFVFTKKGEDKQKLGEDVDSYRYYYNADQTQIIFYDEDGKTYVSTKGKDAEKINNSSLYPIFPANTARHGSTVSVDNLLDNVYAGSGNLYVVDKKGDSEKLASDVSDATLTDDGKYVYFIKDVKDGEGDLCKIKAKKNADEKEIAEDVASFEIAKDGDIIYFLDGDDVLYGKKGNGKAKEIMEDVDSLCITEKDVALFIAEVDDSDNGTLYSCTNGKKAKKVDDDVAAVQATVTGAYYMIGDEAEFDFFASNGSKSFKKLTTVSLESEESDD